MATVIETRDLTVYYGRHRGIVNVNLQVEAGEVFGFLGPNGAGKTTTLRVLLDIIRPTKGQASIFGLDCQEEGPTIRQRTSYLPGELNLYDSMKAYQYLDLLDSLRPQRRNKAYRDELCERLNLDTSRKIREFSKGNKQKTGLVGALMHKPDLLLLDEPTSGLDPLVQQTVLELVKEAKQEGRTVFFSSHILSEVQTVCDRVGIIRDGKVVATERIDTLISQQFRRLRLVFEQVPEENAFALEGVTELGRFDHSVTLEIHQNLQMVMERALQYQIVDIEAHPVTLEEIFLAYYGTGNNHSEFNDVKSAQT